MQSALIEYVLCAGFCISGHEAGGEEHAIVLPESFKELLSRLGVGGQCYDEASALWQGGSLSCWFRAKNLTHVGPAPFIMAAWLMSFLGWEENF